MLGIRECFEGLPSEGGIEDDGDGGRRAVLSGVVREGLSEDS
jgi:hypothetical protein